MQEIQISMREVQDKSKKGLNFQHSIPLKTLPTYIWALVNVEKLLNVLNKIGTAETLACLTGNR